MEHAKHIIRAVLLVVMIGLVFVFARHFAIPETFGQFGHYRAASVAEFAAQTPVHGGLAMCVECHEDDEAVEDWSAGKHGSVSCEVCQGPLGQHPENRDVAPMPVNRSYELCGWCHQKLVARPKDFPQVLVPDHGVEQGAELSEAICLECHDAHNPGDDE